MAEAEREKAFQDPVNALLAAAEAEAKADAAAQAAAAAATAASVDPTGAQVREEAQRRAREKKKPNPNNDERLQELRKMLKEAEEAMGARKEHPFSKWKVGTREGLEPSGPIYRRLVRSLCYFFSVDERI